MLKIIGERTFASSFVEGAALEGTLGRKRPPLVVLGLGLMPRSVESCAATLSAVRLLERACAPALSPDCTTTVIRASIATIDEEVAVTFVGSGTAPKSVRRFP